MAGFFQGREQSLGVHLVPLVSVLSLVFAHPPYHVEGALFDRPNRRDEPLAAEPTIDQHIVGLKPVLDGPLGPGNRWGNFVFGAFLAPDGPGGTGLAGFPLWLPTLAAPQALFGVNTEIQGNKGRAVKEAPHEMFKPPQRLPDHRVEHIRDVFAVPPDPAVGGVVKDKGRIRRHDLVRIDDLLESRRDSIQNRTPRSPLVVFQAIQGVLFHGRDRVKLAAKETIDAADHHQGKHDEERQNFGDRVALRLLKLRVPDDGMELEGLHDIEYNRVDRLRVFIEHLFDFCRGLPHDNPPFLVNLAST